MPHPPFHCPNCRRALSLNGQTITCSSCGERYTVDNDIPQLIARRFLDPFKKTEQHFHDELSISASTGSIAGRSSAFHRHFKRPMLNLPPGSSVLEVACGTRVDGIEIALAGKDVTSLDISSAAIKHAQSLVKRTGVGAHLRLAVADGEHLPFADASFAATFTAASFHHFPHQRAALEEMKRVTKPNGYVIWGVEPQAWPYQTLYKLLAPVKAYIRRRRQRQHNSIADDTTTGYTEAQLRQLFRQVGLDILELQPVKFLSEVYDSGVRMASRLAGREFRPWTPLDRTLARIDAILERLPLVRKLFWHWNVISRVPG
ncbi:MAG: methyltransferase domain-containing protein [Candidatus Kerfeldbacteria bacterium]|nr:methyltransferase domain-containing protein [Candidatus Kerfeldbacteria bacterium]